MSEIKVIVVTPERKVLETQAAFVAVPLFDGEIGIASNRAPLIGRIGFGELRLKKADGVERYYVDGGFLEVLDNTVSIMTSRALPLNDLNRAAAEKQLENALATKALSDDELAAKERKISQARAMMRLTEK